MRSATEEASSVPITAAANLAGCSEGLIRELVRRGILQGVATEQGPGVTIASLVAWLNARPDSLRFPPRIRPHEMRNMEVTNA